MKLTVTKKDLEKKLGYLKGAADPRAERPILGHVALYTKDNFLWLEATDGIYIYAKARVGAKVEKEGGYTIPINELLNIVSKMPDGAIQLKLNKTTLSVWGGPEFKRRFKLAGLPLNQYPILDLEPIDGPELDFNILKLIYDWNFCIDKEREDLQTVYFNFTGDTLETAATDNLRFSDVSIPMQTKSAFSFKLPHKSLSYLVSVIGEAVTFNYYSGALIVESNDVLLRLPVHVGNFVPYKNFIPNDYHTSILIDVSELKAILGQVSTHSKDYADSVEIIIMEDAVNFKVKSSYGESDVAVEAETEGSGSYFVNVPHLQQILKVVGGNKVSIKMGDVGTKTIIVIQSPFEDRSAHYMLAMEKGL